MMDAASTSTAAADETVPPTPFDYYRHQFDSYTDQPAALGLMQQPYFKNPGDNSIGYFAPPQSTTLVYTLTNPEELPFADFELIIRSIHGFKVKSITPCKETSTVTVSVNYPANMRNARQRLGSATKYISVQRINANVQPCELSRLEHLRSKFGFGNSTEPEEPETSRPRKKTRYAAKPSTNL